MGPHRHDYSVRKDDTTLDVVHTLRHLRPAYDGITPTRSVEGSHNFEPKETDLGFIYMYIVGAHITSKYAKMPYQAFVASRIFRPASMNSSSLSSTDDTLQLFAESRAPFRKNDT